MVCVYIDACVVWCGYERDRDKPLFKREISQDSLSRLQVRGKWLSMSRSRMMDLHVKAVDVDGRAECLWEVFQAG